jgi:hypothetical protein
MSAVLWLALTTLASAETRALVVGVSEYQDVALTDLHARADLDALRAALRTHGVDDMTIRLVHDATTEQFRVEARALAERVRPGDVVLLHISGHGTRTPDVGGDEPDGHDESLLFADAILAQPDTHLRDDELAGLVEGLRRRLGPDGQLVVSVDACFSGGAYRAGRVTRGVGATVRGSTDGLDLPSSSESAAAWVMLAASRDHEWAYENADAGTFSLALADQLKEVEPDDTYGDLIARVQEAVLQRNPDQHPSAYGDVHARVLHGGPRARPRAQVVRVTPEGQVVLAAGILHGLTEGRRVRLSHGEHSTSALVTKVSGLTSTVVPDETSIPLWDAEATLPPHPNPGQHLRTVRGTTRTSVTLDVRYADPSARCEPLESAGPPRRVGAFERLAVSVHNPGPDPVWFLMWSVEPAGELFVLSSPAWESTGLPASATWRPQGCMRASPRPGVDAYRVAVASRPFDLTALLGGRPPKSAGQGDASHDVAIIRFDLEVRQSGSRRSTSTRANRE